MNENPAYLQRGYKILKFNKTVSEIFINLKEPINLWLEAERIFDF